MTRALPGDAAPVDAALASLSLAERGFVLGAALMGAPPALADALPVGEATRCRAALRALAAPPAARRTAAVAALTTAALAPLPTGIGTVHADWLRPALEAEATPLLRALVAGLPATVGQAAAAVMIGRGDDPAGRDAAALPEGPLSDGALAELRRAVFVDLCALPDAATDGPAPTWRALAAAGPAALMEGLARLGAETLGVSLRGAPRAVIARAAAQIGGTNARHLLDAATAHGPLTARDAARAIVATVRPDEAGFDAAYVIGAHALAATLTGETDDAAWAVAQRLPLPLGQLLLRAVERRR